MTNYESIKKMGYHELSRFLCELVFNKHESCKTCPAYQYCIEGARNGFLDWLDEEAEGNDGRRKNVCEVPAGNRHIEALEKDLRMRNAHNVPLKISKKALDEFVLNMKINMVSTVKILASSTLHDEFGFGKKRIMQFSKRFGEKADCLVDGFCTWQDQIETLKDECNVEFEIQNNDKDVII